MRVVFAVLCVLMFLSAVVQYNDPDGPIWMVIYGVPAIWTALAALRPERLRGQSGRALLLISLATALVLTVILWPPVGGWWRNQVWSMEIAAGTDAATVAEQAREGMGIMIVTVVLLAVVARSLVGRAQPPLTGRGAARALR